ncbi:MAG TPA: hypothetical protein PK189_08535, partial [bacterium]|nr:hypothetical protein [bacterium]
MKKIFLIFLISFLFYNCSKKRIILKQDSISDIFNPFVIQKFYSFESSLNINIISKTNNINNFFIGKIYYQNNEFIIYIYSPFFTNVLTIHQKDDKINILNRLNNTLYKLNSFSFNFYDYDFSFFFKVFNYCLNIKQNEIKEPEYEFIYKNNFLYKIISPQKQIVEFKNYQKIEDENIFYFPQEIILSDLNYDINTSIEFKDIKINREINKEKFEIRINQ